jgi:predicted NBD/HSP70 family sugar kinase
MAGRDEVGQRSETVRRANLSAIVRELHEHGPSSRSELVARTGLTRSAIRGLIGELVVGGLVSEGQAARLGTPGRPSPVVRLNASSAVVLALDIGVDSLAAAMVGLGGDIVEMTRVDRPRGHSTVDEVVADLARLVTELRARRPTEDRLIGIAAAVPGIVRRTDGFVIMAPNLGWRDVPLRARLARELSTPLPIAVANEADLGALAEIRRGAAFGLSDILFISGEVGVGGGLIVGGQPLTGVAGYGGEVGHMPVNPDGAACRCGSVGCWETEVGEEALLRLAGQPAGGGSHAVEAVLREAAAGSPRARTALDHVGSWLGTGLASLVNVFNPERVVLGGLFSRLHPHVVDALEAELGRRALAASRSLVAVVPGALGVDAALIGAAELALEPILADPAAWLGRRDTLTERASA